MPKITWCSCTFWQSQKNHLSNDYFIVCMMLQHDLQIMHWVSMPPPYFVKGMLTKQNSPLVVGTRKQQMEFLSILSW